LTKVLLRKREIGRHVGVTLSGIANRVTGVTVVTGDRRGHESPRIDGRNAISAMSDSQHIGRARRRIEILTANGCS
jgi:hypothetical protein